MALLRDRQVLQGAFLFRWRGFLPLLLLVPTVVALRQSGYFEYRFGDLADNLMDWFSLVLAYGGLAVRIATAGFVPKGTSGRNARAQRADSLNTTGLYSVVRNPLYLGNLMTLLGFVLAVKVWWLVAIVLPLALFYYERIILTEEAYLVEKFGAPYEDWAQHTPALIPELRRWKRPALPFSAKTAIRREYRGFYLIVVVMTIIEILTDVVGEGESLTGWPRDNPEATAFLVAATLAFIAVRVIHKKTGLLAVSGR